MSAANCLAAPWRLANVQLWHRPLFPANLATAGVYAVVTPESCLYVGESCCIQRRLRSHFRLKRVMCGHVEKLCFTWRGLVHLSELWIWYRREPQLEKRLALEADTIRKLRPVFNLRECGNWRSE